MNERAHTILIGAFVVGAGIILIATTLFFAGAGFGGQRIKVVMVFEGSVKGLTVGAPVALRGVQVGQVTDIQLLLATDRADVIMRVEAELAQDNVQLLGAGDMDAEALLLYMIDNGLRAQLGMQSVLTGLLYVQMDFHSDTPLRMAELDSPHPQIPTMPTELELLRQTLQSIDYSGMARDIADIAASLRTVLQSEAFVQLPTQIQTLLTTADSAGRQLSEGMATLTPRMGALLDQGEQTLATIDSEVRSLAAEGAQSMLALEQTLNNANQALLNAGAHFDSSSPTLHQLNTTLEEVARASRALQSLAQILEEQPDALLRGRRETTP